MPILGQILFHPIPFHTIFLYDTVHKGYGGSWHGGVHCAQRIWKLAWHGGVHIVQLNFSGLESARQCSHSLHIISQKWSKFRIPPPGQLQLQKTENVFNANAAHNMQEAESKHVY